MPKVSVLFRLHGARMHYFTTARISGIALTVALGFLLIAIVHVNTVFHVVCIRCRNKIGIVARFFESPYCSSRCEVADKAEFQELAIKRLEDALPTPRSVTQ